MSKLDIATVILWLGLGIFWTIMDRPDTAAIFFVGSYLVVAIKEGS